MVKSTGKSFFADNFYPNDAVPHSYTVYRHIRIKCKVENLGHAELHVSFYYRLISHAKMLCNIQLTIMHIR